MNYLKLTTFTDHDKRNVVTWCQTHEKKVLYSVFSLELGGSVGKFCFIHGRNHWLSVIPLQLHTTIYTNINCVFSVLENKKLRC